MLRKLNSRLFVESFKVAYLTITAVEGWVYLVKEFRKRPRAKPAD